MNLDWRNAIGRRQQIVRVGHRERLTGLVEAHPFIQRHADAMRDPASVLRAQLSVPLIATSRIHEPSEAEVQRRDDDSLPRLDAAARNAELTVQAITARNRMLRAWGSLPEHSPEADRWIDKAGPEHYAEHLPRLREWVRQLGP